MFNNKLKFRFRSKVKSFIVLMEGGRVGSSYLIEALNSHTEIRALDEVLVRQKHFGASHQLKRVYMHLTPPYFGQYSAIGFKTKLSDILDLEGFAALVGKMGVQIILLRRRNLIKLVMSWINWERLHSITSESNLYDEKNRLPPATVNIDDFAKKLRHVEKQKRNFESYVQNLRVETETLEVFYEDLFLDGQIVFQRIFSLLAVRPSLVQGKAKKNTSDDLRKAIVNFDELRNNYIGTSYEWMFDEILFPPP